MGHTPGSLQGKLLYRTIADLLCTYIVERARLEMLPAVERLNLMDSQQFQDTMVVCTLLLYGTTTLLVNSYLLPVGIMYVLVSTAYSFEENALRVSLVWRLQMGGSFALEMHSFKNLHNV
jgi:hypothetical protein